MRDYQQLERLSETVSFGVLSQDVVIAGDRLLSEEELGGRERQALEKGRELLRGLADPEAPVASPPEPHRLAENSRALTTLTAAEVTAEGEDVRSYFRDLADALDEVLSAGEVGDYRNKVEEITQLFSTIGQLELSRANDLSIGLADRPWRT